MREINDFVSAIKGWDKLHLNLHVGGRFPIDSDEETMNVRYSAMVDYSTRLGACGGRSVHKLATEVSIKYEEGRERQAS